MAHPQLNSMSLLGPRSGGGASGCSTGWSPSRVSTTGCTSPTCGPGAGWPNGMDRAARARLVPALGADLDRQPGRPRAQRVRHRGLGGRQAQGRGTGRRTVVLCTDVTVHRIWVAEGTDLFLVTSPAAAASVRRYLPRAPVSVVPPPVRSAFYAAPSQEQARGAGRAAGRVLRAGHRQWLGIRSPGGERRRAGRGRRVRAGRGRPRPPVERRLRELAADAPDHAVRLHRPGTRADGRRRRGDCPARRHTCSEARVVGRQLLLLDVMPGHGRDNLQHELELGGAECVPTPGGVTASALALRDELRAGAAAARPPRWEPAYVAALQQIGLDLQASPRPPLAATDEARGGSPMMRTLFLNPPSYDGFDGGAGARYQAKREIRSFWYPTWLAQPAAIVPDSLLVDAPPAGLTLADVVPLAAARPGRPAHQLAHLRRRRQSGRGA